MSVVSVLELNAGRGGEGNVTRDKSWRTYTRTFRVITNNNFDDTLVVSTGVSMAYGIYAGSIYPTDWGAWCTKISCHPEGKSKTVWLVTVSYTSEWQPQQNPLADPAIIEWSSTPYQRPYGFDKNGNALLNSAGDTYYRPVMGDDSRWEIRVQKNLAAVPQSILGCKDAINSDSFVIDGVSVTQYQAKVSSISIGKFQQRNNIGFRVLAYTLHLDTTSVGANGTPCGWIKQVVDEGLNQTVAGVSLPCCDNMFNPVRVPVLLNGSGLQQSNPTASSVKYNSFHIYPEISFTANLPLS